jgi:resuscitation-promoting factor RpfB
MKPTLRALFAAIILTVFAFFFAACSGPQATAESIQVVIQTDATERTVSVPGGSSVSQAIQIAGLELGTLDELTPPGYTVLENGTVIQIRRLSERFEVESVVLPFEHQTIRNEALPEGETRLLQPGANGIQEITYRIVIEEDIEISRTAIRSQTIEEPMPEIVMIGSQGRFQALALEGSVAYLSAGNAWLLQAPLNERRPLTLSGDLDGRVFELSPDSNWLLFTRGESSNDEINSLWVVSTRDSRSQPISLFTTNIIHFAAWSPAIPPNELNYTIAFSTVEPRLAAPGWQANNDLMTISLSTSGTVIRRNTVLSTNAGGQYGWWGTTFAWSPDGDQVAYARPDSVGLVNLEDEELEELVAFVPLQTGGDWAWVPPIAWDASGSTIYMVLRDDPQGDEPPGNSPVFNLTALPLDQKIVYTLVEQTGMFALPSAAEEVKETLELENLAYLQATFPLESRDSTYRIYLIDRDGSNKRLIFPHDDETGMRPNRVIWSPDGDAIAFIYKDDLYSFNLIDEGVQQITADGQTQSFDWNP